MKNYLEQALRQKVKMSEAVEIYPKLPLIFRGRYKILDIQTNGIHWIAINPRSRETHLVQMRKNRMQVEQVLGLNCAIFLDDTTFYIREKLLEEGVPFVVKDKCVFLPFLGYLLGETKGRELPPVSFLSFLTQKMLLIAIYERWQNVRVTEAAKRLEISKKSASRCFDELEYLHIPVLGKKGKSRVIVIPEDVHGLWEQIHTLLRDPVIKKYTLKEDMKMHDKAGISALCEYSLLSDNAYPTYAITKKEVASSGIKGRKEIVEGEDAGCVVLELGYFIEFKGKKVQDPLSVALTITEEEKDDERVNLSIEHMLEEYL